MVELSDYDDVMFNPYGIIKPLSTGVQQETYQIYTEELDSLTVKLYTFSDELTQFCESYSDYEGTSQDPFIDYRLPVFSNIENGYGLFTSYDYNQKSIIID